MIYKIYTFCLLFRNHICVKVIDLEFRLCQFISYFVCQIYSTNTAYYSDVIVNYITIKNINTISQQSWMRLDF